jgi:parvulin-like peptidyl-prolyl isomerase
VADPTRAPPGRDVRNGAIVRASWLVGCMVPLALMGCTADGPSTVATWHGGRLERADYESWRAFHQLDDRAEAIREQVFVESLAAISRERGVEHELRTQVEIDGMRQQVLLLALRDHVMAQVEVSEEEVESLRRAHPEAFRVPRKLRLRYVYKRFDAATAAAVRTRMADILRQLREGADFKDLARRESESQTRLRDGDLGFVAADDLPAPVGAAVRDLTPGQLTGLVEHGEGLSIFLCESVKDARNPTPDEVRQKLRANLLRQRRREQWNRYQEGLLDSAGLQLDARSPTSPIRLNDYELSAEAFAEIVSLRSNGKTVAELTQAQLDQTLRHWALGVVCARRAVELKLDQDPHTAAALRWRRMEILAQRELVRRVDERLREPSEKELRAWFEANAGRFREPAAYDLAVIHFGAKEGQSPGERVGLALQVARRLEAGEITFEEAARRYSTHRSAPAGGRLGWRTRPQATAWGPTATRALAELRPGERTGLLRLQSGLWIFQVRDRREGRPQTFEAARERVRGEQRKRQIRELEAAVREEHLNGIGLVIRP